MSNYCNKWLDGGLPIVNDFTVDKTKDNYYIKYFEAEKYSLALNNDWKIVKRHLEELNRSINEINEGIDSEDYKARSNDVMKAIGEATSALDENFSKLFNSVIKRMNESAESDEWFSENARNYSKNVLGAILGMGMSYKPLSNMVNLSNNHDNFKQLSSNSLQYGPAPIPAQEASSGQLTNMASNKEVDINELKYGPSLESGTSTPSTSASEPSYFADDHTAKIETPPATQEPEVQTYSVGEGRTIDIPDSVKQTGLCPNYTGYDKYYGKWNRGTMQRELSEQWGAAGKPSSNGIATLNDRYLVAVSPKFGKVGDDIDIVLRDGQVIKAKIADSKGPDATSEWGHVLTSKGAVDIIEWEASGPKSEINLGTWRNVGVDKIVNLTD